MSISRLDQAREAIRNHIVQFLDDRGFIGLDQQITVEAPTERGHGDLTTSFALKVARRTKMNPRALAQEVVDTWPQMDEIEHIEMAGPGFINFAVKTRWLAEVINLARTAGQEYGNSQVGQGARVLIEFVSSNPTGPMVVVSGRSAAVGDSLARIMQAAGFRVDREFYVNDAGNQIRTLGQALMLRLRQLTGEDVERDWPEGVYPGDYVKPIARRYREDHPETNIPDLGEQDFFQLGRYAAEYIRSAQEAILKEFRVTFDQWVSEQALREAKEPESVLARLEERGYLARRDGATWFLSERFGDDKDRVVIKADGSYTYFVPDAAYHAGKFDRGYDYVIDLLGPDHHGYIARIRAVVEALGYSPDRLKILIVQLVRLVRGGELVRMSKRGGDFVTLEELLEESGVDPARYFFLERAPETPMDFNLDLAQLKSNDNPVYYVQYAGARIHSILRQWRAMNNGSEAALDLSVLDSEMERDLMVAIARFPEVVARAAEERAPQFLPRYLTEIAGLFHAFYRQHRILEESAPIRLARVALIEAVLVVITRGLDLMGIRQPERM